MKTVLAILAVVAGSLFTQTQFEVLIPEKKQKNPGLAVQRPSGDPNQGCGDAAARGLRTGTASATGQAQQHAINTKGTGAAGRSRGENTGCGDPAGMAITEEGGLNQHADRPKGRPNP